MMISPAEFLTLSWSPNIHVEPNYGLLLHGTESLLEIIAVSLTQALAREENQH